MHVYDKVDEVDGRPDGSVCVIRVCPCAKPCRIYEVLASDEEQAAKRRVMVGIHTEYVQRRAAILSAIAAGEVPAAVAKRLRLTVGTINHFVRRDSYNAKRRAETAARRLTFMGAGQAPAVGGGGETIAH